MRSLWVAIDSRCDGTRVLATAGPKETVLKARLSATAQDSLALPRLLEALALWQGMPVHAVVVAGVTDLAGSSVTRLKLDFDADFAGPLFTLEVVDAHKRRHRDQLGDMGSFRDLRQLVMFEVAR